MIPHRMPSSEIFGNGLKSRVSACRKRLRVNRSAHKAQADDQPLAFGGETTAAFLDEYLTVRESIVGEREAAELQDDAWQRAEQEVGIT